MHMGNLFCAVMAYISAKSKGGYFLVRIEDLDALRCPRAAARDIIDLLAALGIKSDAPIIYQSERTAAYSAAEKALRAVADVYPCYCSRAELHAEGVVRLADGGILYKRTCKNKALAAKKAAAGVLPAYRIWVPDEIMSFTDGIAGEVRQNLADECGDFIIRRSDGVYAYQLAVVVDDGESGVTEVVRGADLLYDTPRQIYLQRLLGLVTPEYYHIPLLLGPSGRKLSKSEGDSAERLFKRESVSAIIGGLGFAAGLLPENRPATLDELVALYSPQKLKESPALLPPNLCE